MEQKKICYRCLLEDMDENEIKNKVQELIYGIPEDEKTDEEEYRRRLDICKSCDSLISGTCKKCGCYVELRAAGRKRTCPDTENRWG
ncbi:MAG: hypothetical protein J5372_05460 [Lachnospiraceae bacterium]|nr:hypothetical protein [Lachnospiraceae bacterium]MBR4144478.1 hypothetical protein [Lachnospiraceae bacterium]MBR6475600.1 hypothetical protein [Lachnospiraceae bacterium]